MPTTSNFGWTTPADTDLVKDGAAAIRTLGNGIDTSFIDLKGGTTGQVLSKASNTDLDFTWVAQDDSNAIQNAIVDAKGDLIAATAADTPARLAVGTDGQVLTADSTTATGLKWASTSSTPTFVGCRVYATSAQSIPNNTMTVRTFDSEDFDTDNFHSTSSNTSRITIPTGKGGKYLFFWNGGYAVNGTGRRIHRFYKNGTGTIGYGFVDATPNSNNGILQAMSVIINCSAGDYVEVGYYQTSGGNLNTEGGSDGCEQFGCTYLGA